MTRAAPRCSPVLVWARPARLRSAPGPTSPAPIPFAYAAIKPVFIPDATLRTAEWLPATARLPVPPGLVARLRAGGNSRDGQATDTAVRLAIERARASGLPTPFGAGPRASRQPTIAGGRMGAGVPADRLAAALLIPIGDRELTALIERAYPVAPTDDHLTTEDTTHVA